MKKRYIPIYFLLFFLLYPSDGWTKEREKKSRKKEEKKRTSASPKLFVIPIHGTIEGVLFNMVKRRVAEATKRGAQILLFEISTYGGQLHAALEMSSYIARIPQKYPGVKTVAYVQDKAISAGALITMACREIYMAENSEIGDCAPIISTSEGPKVIGEKIQSPIRARFRSLAESNNYPAPLAEAMVTEAMEVYEIRTIKGGKSEKKVVPARDFHIEKYRKTKGKEVEIYASDEMETLYELTLDKGKKIIVSEEEKKKRSYQKARELYRITLFKGGTLERTFITKEDWEGLSSREKEQVVTKKTVSKSGQLLTLTSKEALEYGLATALINSTEKVIDHLAKERDQTFQVTRMTPTSWESFIRFIQSPGVVSLLLLIGLLCVYTEIKMPGFGLPGALGLLCLGLVFFGGYLADLTDVIDMVIFLIGVILVMVEIFVIPGFGLAGIAGMICMFAGLVLALQPFVIPTQPWEMKMLERNLLHISLAMLGSLVGMIVLAKFLPKTPAGSRLILTPPPSTEETPEEDKRPGGDKRDLLGIEGTALTALRPAGKMEKEGEIYDVVSQGEFIDKGTRLKVLAVEGNRIVVEESGTR